MSSFDTSVYKEDKNTKRSEWVNATGSNTAGYTAIMLSFHIFMK